MKTVEKNNALPRNRSIRLSEIDLLNLVYIALIVAVVVVCRSRISWWWESAVAYAFLGAGLLVLLKFTAGRKNAVLEFVHAWYTPPLFIFYYESTYLLNQSLGPLYAPWVARLAPGFPFTVARLGGRTYFDALLQRADQWLFGFQPSLRFADAFPWPWFGELMHLAYFSFYIFIPALGCALWFRRRRVEFDDFLFRATFTMLACCLIFVVFPTAGPRHFLGLAGGPSKGGYAFAAIMGLIFENLDYATGAWPSSHVAVALAVVLSSWRYERRLCFVLAPLFVGLCAATLYTREHFALDVLSGLIAGPLLYALAGPVHRVFARRLCRFGGSVPKKIAGGGEPIGT